MAYGKIELERHGDIAIIRLNDPATLNAVTIQTIEEIDQALDAIKGSARAMILTGAGRGFCSGANLSAGMGDRKSDGPYDSGSVLESHINPLMLRLRDLPIPWVSAIKGSAAGVGCSFALAADIVICGESAFFLQAFARIGLVPDGGSSWLLARSIGRARAMEMMLLGERIPAAKALEWGMINRIVPDEQVMPVALELAKALGAGPTQSLAMIRRMAWSAADSSFEEAMTTERNNQRLAGQTQDHREGVIAFLAKRPAQFTGQ
ncbi:MAG: 2-(1,2-epoxy-1,2-dihydrophenyl)acetyl-CoA isomerase [Alphaproteobacteria bacterium 32-64-14]|nr:MAG: 2-(1,2-epoxy-1,2-dihydrophenyl)acetyl-CoA isomerase [Alphaproteobacteria bacterium 32-64-14]